MALLLHNSVASVARGSQPVPNTQHAPIYIKPAAPVNLDMAGVQVTTNLLADPGTVAAPTSWHVNDVMTLEDDSGYQVLTYTVRSASPPPKDGELRVWRITIQGAIR